MSSSSVGPASGGISGVSTRRASVTGAKAVTMSDSGAVTLWALPFASQPVRMESESLPTGMAIPSAGQSSTPTARPHVHGHRRDGPRHEQCVHRRQQDLGRRRRLEMGPERQQQPGERHSAGRVFPSQRGRHPRLLGRRLRRRRGGRLPFQPFGLVRAVGVAVPADLARRLPLRPAVAGQRRPGRTESCVLPHPRRLHPEPQHPHGRLQPERVLARAPAVRPRPLAPGITDNQWLLQYQMSLGAHGAHTF